MKKANTNLHIRINSTLKKQFQLACSLKETTPSQQIVFMISDFIKGGFNLSGMSK